MENTTNEDFLKQSLLYQMSLGSKELYHSNVWAWLIENESKFLKVFFDDFDDNTYKVLGVSREFLHRDLIIWLQKKGYENKEEKYYYVIENKIKSLPTKEQLQGYTENLWENVLLGATFTGIENTLCDDFVHIDNKDMGVSADWKFVSYETIAERIYNIAKESSQQLIQKKLSQINEYCKIICAINQVLKEAMMSYPQVIDYSCESLRQLRLHDVFIKLKGADFMRFANVRKSQIDSLIPAEYGFKLIMNQSYNNGKATLDFRFTNWKEGCIDHFTIGVQVEEYQFRLVAERSAQHHTAQEVFDAMAEHKWFDGNYDPRIRPRMLFGRETSLSKSFDKYKGGYIFVYQYFNIKGCTYEQIFDEIKASLKKARVIIESGNY